MLLLPVLFLLSGVKSTPTFKHRDSSTGETLVCDKCRPGQYMAAYCTATTPTVCAPCQAHHFTELWNYLPKCIYCYNMCTQNQEVETECSATTNRVCRCKQGFYSVTSDFCDSHTECGPGYGVQTKGTSQEDTVCQQCPEGYFSNSSSALESCVKHRECPSGQIALINGTDTHNPMCGTCEGLARGGETLRKFYSGFFSMLRIRVGKLRRFVASYIHRSEDGAVPRQRAPLLEKINAWLAQAPAERLAALPQMLTDSAFCSMREKLKAIINGIKQQSPTCALAL